MRRVLGGGSLCGRGEKKDVDVDEYGQRTNGLLANALDHDA